MKPYVDHLITNSVKGYNPRGHINEIVLPELSVLKVSAKIASYDGSNMRIVSTIKSPEGETPVITINYETADAYLLKEHALKAFASDKDAENEESPFMLREKKARVVKNLLSISREYGLADYMNTVANFTNSTTLSGTSQWGGSADDPLANIATAVGTVADAINQPDGEISLIFSKPAWRKFIFLDEVKDLLGFKYSQTPVIQPSQIAAAFGIKQVILANGRYNTAVDGQTDAYDNLWGKHVWAGYLGTTPKGASTEDVCFGYTPRRKSAFIADRWYDNDRKGDWVRCTDEYDQFIMEEKAMYMLKDAVA